MKLVSPSVIKLAETVTNGRAVQQMLEALGVSSNEVAKKLFLGHASGETIVETAGRTCYRSFEPGLNPNVTKVRDDPVAYFKNLIESGHGSVLEHCQVTFAFLNISRVCTHELVRHRIGVAISQESLRYVRPKTLGLWVPPGLTPEQQSNLTKAFEQIEKGYAVLENSVNWDNLPFHEKKSLTSAFRRVLPIGMATNMVWSANLRTLRHVIEVRTDPAAEIEIRFLFDEVGKICKHDYPLAFQDFERTLLPDGTGQWKPSLRSKV